MEQTLTATAVTDEAAVAPRTARGVALSAIRTADRALDLLLVAIPSAALLAELGILFVATIARTLGESLVWAPELATACLVVLTFLGGAASFRTGRQITIQAVVRLLPSPARVAVAAAANAAVGAVAVLVTILALPLVRGEWGAHSPLLGIPQGWTSLAIVVCMIVVGMSAVRNGFDALRSDVRATLAGVGFVVLVAGALVAAQHTIDGQLRAAALTLLGIAFLALLLGGVPIGFVFVAVSLLYLFASGGSRSVVPVTLEHGSDSFLLLAIPFFTLAGFLMTEGRLSEWLAEFLMGAFGRMRGGLLQVVVVSMYVFSGVSGSKVADVAAVGTSMKSMIRKRGYEPGELAAVLASSAVMGETIPPSIALIVLASVTTLSVGDLFLGGIIPAGVIAVSLMAMIYVRARVTREPRAPATPAKEVARRALRALPALSVPFVLVGGIVKGVGTPTEVSSFSVVYALVLTILLGRRLQGRALARIIADTTILSGMILFLVNTASVFSWSLTVAQVPHKIASLMGGLGHDWLFLIVSIGVLIVLGSLLEGLAALLVLAPLLAPLAAEFGIDPLHYAIVIIIAMGLGAFMPPIGVGLYVACAVSDSTIEAGGRRMLPYLVVIVAGLLVVAFVPWFTLVLPRMLR